MYFVYWKTLSAWSFWHMLTEVGGTAARSVKDRFVKVSAVVCLGCSLTLSTTYYYHTVYVPIKLSFIKHLSNILLSLAFSSQVDDTICSAASFSLHYRAADQINSTFQLFWDSNLNVNSPIKSWTTSLSLLLGCKYGKGAGKKSVKSLVFC